MHDQSWLLSTASMVTAERRQSTVQTTPLAITAVSGDRLREQHIGDLADLAAKVPNLSFSQNAGGSARIFIRGIGWSADAYMLSATNHT
jgi:iron complex outermembrane receptor protein